VANKGIAETFALQIKPICIQIGAAVLAQVVNLVLFGIYRYSTNCARTTAPIWMQMGLIKRANVPAIPLFATFFRFANGVPPELNLRKRRENH
jgi:hypothetical protein